MNPFKRSLELVGQVLGLVVGSEFVLPVNEVMEKHWNFAYHV